MHEAGVTAQHKYWANYEAHTVYYSDGTFSNTDYANRHNDTIYPASLFLTPEKECIGWKLKEECKKYEKQAEEIAFNDTSGNYKFSIGSDGCYFWNPSPCANNLRAAGVLELWFDKVYKEEYSVGDWRTTIDGFDNARGSTYGGSAYKPDGGLAYKPDYTFQIDSIAHNDIGEPILFPSGSDGVYAKATRPATPAEIEAAQVIVCYRNLHASGETGFAYADLDRCKANFKPTHIAVLMFTTRNGKTKVKIVHEYE